MVLSYSLHQNRVALYLLQNLVVLSYSLQNRVVLSKLSSQSHLGWNSHPSPWLKAWPQLFNICMKPVKGYRCVE